MRFAYLNYVRLCLRPQSTHRVAIADFWRISYPDGKISPGWCGGGVHAHSLSAYYRHVQSYSIRSCWEGRYTPSISSLPYIYSVFAPIGRDIARWGAKDGEMAKEIKRDVGVRWREIKKSTVPECRDPVLCFKTLIFTKTSPKCLFSFSSPCSETQVSASFGRVNFGGGFWKQGLRRHERKPYFLVKF